MSRKSIIAYVVLPICAFGAYFLCLKCWPVFAKHYLHTEHGAIEWGTAVMFLAAATIGVRLAWTTHGRVPTWCTALYSLFALAGLFVALEEISYGQKFFNWASPRWFVEHNSKSETNLHNMFDSKPSNLLRSIATVGCPVFCIVLPIWRRVRQPMSQVRTWADYCIPNCELATMALLTIVLSIFNKVPSIKGMATWSGHLGELKELFWGIIATGYAVIISNRFASNSRRRSNGIRLPNRLETYFGGPRGVRPA